MQTPLSLCASSYRAAGTKLSKLLQNCVSTASSTIDFSPFVQSALSILLTSPHVKGKHMHWRTFEIV